MFRLTYLEVSNYYVFSCDKLTNIVHLVYLECQLQKDRYGWRIFNLKC